MSEPTTPAGATPAAGGATPPQTPPAASAPAPTPQAQPAPTPAPDPSAPDDALGLGDAGKRALDAMKAERNAAIAASKAAERELEQLRTASLSESEKAIAAARKAGADEVTERLHARVRRAETKLALARAGAVPSLIEDLANAAEFAALTVDDTDQVTGLDDALKAHKVAGARCVPGAGDARARARSTAGHGRRERRGPPISRPPSRPGSDHEPADTARPKGTGLRGEPPDARHPRRGGAQHPGRRRPPRHRRVPQAVGPARQPAVPRHRQPDGRRLDPHLRLPPGHHRAGRGVPGDQRRVHPGRGRQGPLHGRPAAARRRVPDRPRPVRPRARRRDRVPARAAGQGDPDEVHRRARSTATPRSTPTGSTASTPRSPGPRPRSPRRPSRAAATGPTSTSRPPPT